MEPVFTPPTFWMPPLPRARKRSANLTRILDTAGRMVTTAAAFSCLVKLPVLGLRVPAVLRAGEAEAATAGLLETGACTSS
jgi:hypothetical protein